MANSQTSGGSQTYRPRPAVAIAQFGERALALHCLDLHLVELNATARDLIARKKYLNPQLDKFGMAKAKELCDQIELLVFELTQLSPEVGAVEVERIRGMVSDRQLLMKIRLVKKELERSEV